MEDEKRMGPRDPSPGVGVGAGRGREMAKKIELIRGDTVATGPSERCQQFNQCI